MNVRKFTANTSREALRMLRDALGADAVILSNKTVNGKVEIMAMAEESVPEYAPVEKPRSMAPEVARLTPAFPAESARSFSPRSFAPEPEAEAVRPLITRPSVASPVSSANAAASSELHDVMSEIRSMSVCWNRNWLNCRGPRRSKSNRIKPKCCAKCWPLV